jgi:hypothetical protein
VANDGGANYFNNDHTLASINSGPWDDFSPVGSFAWKANFASVSTPIPAALPLFATGLGALGLLGWRRKLKARAVA